MSLFHLARNEDVVVIGLLQLHVVHLYGCSLVENGL